MGAEIGEDNGVAEAGGEPGVVFGGHAVGFGGGLVHCDFDFLQIGCFWLERDVEGCLLSGGVLWWAEEDADGAIFGGWRGRWVQGWEEEGSEGVMGYVHVSIGFGVR